MGKIFSTTLASSTCLSVHFSSGWSGLFIAALLRNSKFCVGIGVIGVCSSTSLTLSEETELVDMLITTLLELFAFLLLNAAEAKTCWKKKPNSS